MLTKALYDRFQDYNLDQNSKNKKRTFESLFNREAAFEWLHAGTLRMPIAEVNELIQKNSLQVARTGHLGNWQEIFAGRAGALDHNGTSCGASLAFPYIYDMNQTENEELTSGDTVYLVGSMVNKDHRTILEVYTWDGNSFVQRSRQNSYFVPFVLTSSENGLVPLCAIHKPNCLLYKNARFFSDTSLENKEKITQVLKFLIEEIMTNKDCGLHWSDLFDKVVSVDGIMKRADIQWTSNGIQVGTTVFEDLSHLLEAIFIPMQAVQNPVWFINNVRALPDCMPFMSLPLLSYFDCLFNQSKDSQNPISIYLEWGAFGSAAYPPRVRGYFKEKVRVVKKIANMVLQKDHEIKPVFYLLLPSSIFNLLPNSAYPEDASLIALLFEEVLNESALKTQTDAGFVMKVIEEITLHWWLKNKDKLSNYYKVRYSDRRSVFHRAAVYEKAETVFLPQFYQLTLQQACMIVGGMFQAAQFEKEQQNETVS